MIIPDECRIYDSDGAPVDRALLLERLAAADVTLFGELHGHPAVHALEQELLGGLHEIAGAALVVGAEMLEADNQLVLDEYLAGLILHQHLVAEAKVWENYERDYRPLVEFAKDHGLSFVATNIPRRYANLVAREGLAALERLSPEARRAIAPLPIVVDMETPGYREMAQMGPAGGRMPFRPENFVAAQAVKDATMAHFIALRAGSGRRFIHYNGVFHSQNRGGIGWYLKKAEPGLSIVTVSCVEDTELRPEHHGLGDLVALVAPQPE